MSLNPSETIAAITELRRSKAFSDYFMHDLVKKREAIDVKILDGKSLSDVETRELRAQRVILIELERKLARDFEANRMKED